MVDPDLTYPRTHQYGFSFQREVGWNSVVEVNYIGRQGRKLFGGYDANQVDITNNGFLDRLPPASRPGDARERRHRPELSHQPAARRRLAPQTRRRDAARSSCLRQTAGTGGNVRLADGTIATNIVDAGSVAQAAFLVTQGTRTVQRRPDAAVPDQRLQPVLLPAVPAVHRRASTSSTTTTARATTRSKCSSAAASHAASASRSATRSPSRRTRARSTRPSPSPTAAPRSPRPTRPSTSATATPTMRRSDFDRRHALQGYFTAELPFGRGKRLLSDANPWSNQLVGGFELAGIVRWYSGRPFTVYSGINSVSQVVQSPASCNGCTPDMGSIVLEGGRNFIFTQEQRAHVLRARRRASWATRAATSSPAPSSSSST